MILHKLKAIEDFYFPTVGWSIGWPAVNTASNSCTQWHLLDSVLIVDCIFRSSVRDGPHLSQVL